MKPLRALFIGDYTLLTRCADAFHGAGHVVVGVVSGDARIGQWARDRGHMLIEKGPKFEVAARSLDFDVLFSVGNLDMLSDEMLGAAKRVNLNFHDGPLPAFAGLNAPVWALLEGARTYGVTWHEMTSAPDGGRIAAQEAVEISREDTALSLNAKCYEAGFASFGSLLERLAAGRLELTPQEGARTYFGRYRRPSAAATLDFRLPAEDVLATIRALTFGPYHNPLAVPKVWGAGRVLLATAAEPASGVFASGQPGEVLEASGEGAVVATATQPVRLGLSDPRGGTVEIPVGTVFEFPPPGLLEKFGALGRRAASAEDGWVRAWRTATSANLAYPRATGGIPGFHRFVIAAPLEADRRLAGLVAWVSKAADGAEASLMLRTEAHDVLLGEASAWFSAWRPVTIALRPAMSMGEVAAEVVKACEAAESAGPMFCDLRHRIEAAGAGVRVPAVAAVMGACPAEPPDGADVVVRMDGDEVEIIIRKSSFDENVASTIADHIRAAMQAAPGVALTSVALDPAELRERMAPFEAGPSSEIPDTRVFELVSRQAKLTPERIALRTRWEALTYAELDSRVDRAAADLSARGIRRGDIIAVLVERRPNLIVALLAVMKCGAAYLPLDPSHPADRTAYMLADSKARLAIVDNRAASLAIETADIEELIASEAQSAGVRVAASDLAYLIYTSGSTGKPKGVMISHGALENFLVGMDAEIPHDPPGTWLAVTSPTFDISALELFWTLARGFTVALHVPQAVATRAPAFSLFYFAASADASASYKLLMEGARFADANGFEAIWTPERHFHEFGGPYPNPAITSAAIASVTERVRIRAGSIVLPLHDPIRVAEDWAAIDNISNGRVGLAIATGWNPGDFVLSPSNYANRKSVILDYLEQVRRLWRGETLTRTDGLGAQAEVRTYPRPVQQDLPVWLTAARNPETFELAGELGVNVLTHLLGMSFDEAARNIALYRSAWARSRHPGQGRVALMLHTFVAETDEEARKFVRIPMREYLRTAADLVKAAAWTFPTIQQEAQKSGRTPAEVFDAQPLTPAEMDAVLEHAFERYYETSGLFGDHEACVSIVRQAAGAGVDEIACLIDFGIDPPTVVEHLPRLARVLSSAKQSETTHYSVVEDLAHFQATHLQCTPTMASLIVDEARRTRGLEGLTAILVGGEALHGSLAQSLLDLAPGAVVLQMYGPTETTIWSTCARVRETEPFVALGAPIANTSLRIVGTDGQDRPCLVAGELLIGGAGVAEGYWRRPELTAERFLDAGRRWYRTGDVVRRYADGRLEFLGRTDNQIKLRGHRIELGEIEALLCEHEDVLHAAVVLREGGGGADRLEAFYVLRPGGAAEEADLRSFVAQRLPAVMAPSHFQRLARMPQTSSGKIDRTALPLIATAPAGEHADLVGLERLVAKVWSELLGKEGIGPDDNFFDLGGHSLLAVQLQRRLAQEAIDRPVAITDIFQYPTVRGLANYIGGGRSEAAVESGSERGRKRMAARRRRSGGGG